MNIRAVMAALDEYGLDHMAKVALVVMACRADRQGACRVSVPRVAADIGVHYRTAARALDRLVGMGYLAVENPPGRTSLWLIDPGLCARGTPGALSSDPGRSVTDPALLERAVGVEGEVQGGAAAPPDLNGRTSAPGENGNGRAHGDSWSRPMVWVELADGTVSRRE